MDTDTDKLTDRQRQVLDFLLFVDRFKMIERWGLVSNGSRRETDAEHTWHMALYAVLLHREIALECDLAHALKLVLIHDLVEIHAGDAPAYDAVAQAGQAARERAAADRLYAMLPTDIGEDLKAMWYEFEAAETPEARFAHAVDRLQALGQSVASGGKGWRQHNVKRAQTERRMAPAREVDPEITALVDALLRRAEAEGLWPAPESDADGAPAAKLHSG